MLESVNLGSLKWNFEEDFPICERVTLSEKEVRRNRCQILILLLESVNLIKSKMLNLYAEYLKKFKLAYSNFYKLVCVML